MKIFRGFLESFVGLYHVKKVIIFSLYSYV
jgi:hypothetical protein